MRRVRISLTARLTLQRMLEQGADKFGPDVASEKAHLLDQAIAGYLARYPQNGFYDETRKVYAYPVSHTPFTVVYRFDDSELRVLFIVHRSADRTRLRPDKVTW